MNDFETILAKIGLTQMESKVYLALLELREARTGVLCKFTKIASSNIYNILASLIKHGLASYKVKNNIKIFMPAPPEALSELFLEKQKQLDNERKEVLDLIANLKKKELKEEPFSDYQYFEGIAGTKSMWLQVLSMMGESEHQRVFMGFKKAELHHPLMGFFDEFEKATIKKKTKYQMIVPTGEVIFKKLRDKPPLREVRFLDIDSYCEWTVVKDCTILWYAVGKVPKGFLIKDQIIADTFKEVFDKLWAQSKKL